MNPDKFFLCTWFPAEIFNNYSSGRTNAFWEQEPRIKTGYDGSKSRLSRYPSSAIGSILIQMKQCELQAAVSGLRKTAYPTRNTGEIIVRVVEKDQ